MLYVKKIYSDKANIKIEPEGLGWIRMHLRNRCLVYNDRDYDCDEWNIRFHLNTGRILDYDGLIRKLGANEVFIEERDRSDYVIILCSDFIIYVLDNCKVLRMTGYRSDSMIRNYEVFFRTLAKDYVLTDAGSGRVLITNNIRSFECILGCSISDFNRTILKYKLTAFGADI